MSDRIRCLLLAGILLCAENIFSQRLGLLPPDVKWMQLRHDSLRIIYPEGQEETARRVASLMLKVAVADPIVDDCECHYKPISVLLQPQTNISNGYVGLAPYMSEFYLQPHENPFALGSLPWADLLALHEYRHVQQVNAANTGLSHIVKQVFGDLAFSGMYNLSVPNWYREGDAVYSETKWSKQGRGRLSSFTLPFKEKLREGKPWDYYVVRNGSYRQYTPDFYPLGYLIVQYGNHVFGETTWDTIMRKAPRFKYLFGPFSGVVKRHYGERNKHFYQDAMNWYGSQWKSKEVPDIHYPTIALQEKDLNHVYFDMTYPDIDEDGSIYSAVTTFDKTTAIYQFQPDGRRKKIKSMGLQQDSYFDHARGRFVWTELRFDPRWVRRDKNVIVLYDRKTGTKKSFEPEKGYFMPSLDVSGQKIVALHVDSTNHFQLKILDAASGRVLHTLPNDDNLYLGYPVFDEEGQSIISSARNKDGRMCLVQQDIESGMIKPITHYSYSVLGRPVIHGPWIFIAAGIDQLDQVYAVDKAEGIFYQVSGGNAAHYDPAWDPVQDAIVCAEYRLDGKKLVRLPGLPRQWRLTNLDDGVKDVAGASTRNILAEPPVQTSYSIKKYSPWANAFNVHSWTVTADDPVWGFEARSDNIMNNIAIAGGYEYNRNNKAGGPYVDFRIGIWYPELTFGLSSTSREIELEDGREFRVLNDRIRAGIALPLFFTPGVYRQTLRVSTNYNSGVSKLRPKVDGIEDFNFNYASHRLLLVNSRNMAYRQAMPTWGQRMDVVYSHEISGIQISQFYASTDLALPAIFSTHYLLAHGEFLSQDISEGSIQLGSNYAGARGFDVADGKTQYRLGVTYGFPLFYPDTGIGNIFYTRRVRLQPFFDVAYTNDPTFPSSFMRSTGLEWIIDFDFPPVSIGFRYSRLLSGYIGNQNRFELFIPSQRF